MKTNLKLAPMGVSPVQAQIQACGYSHVDTAHLDIAGSVYVKLRILVSGASVPARQWCAVRTLDNFPRT